MQRSFLLTLAVGGTFYNLYTLMLAVVGAVPTDGILPDRVSNLEIREDTGSITIADRNNANTTGITLAAKTDPPFARSSTRNTICLRDYFLKGVAANAVAQVVMESM